MLVYTRICTYLVYEVHELNVCVRNCIYRQYMYVLYVYVRICMYCMYVYVCTYLSVLHVYGRICMYMYLYACMSVHVRIVRICTYMYVFLMDIYLDTCRYEQILTIRTYTYIRTGYVQCANVRIRLYFCANMTQYVTHFFKYVRIRTTWFTDVSKRLFRRRKFIR